MEWQSKLRPWLAAITHLQPSASLCPSSFAVLLVRAVNTDHCDLPPAGEIALQHLRHSSEHGGHIGVQIGGRRVVRLGRVWRERANLLPVVANHVRTLATGVNDDGGGAARNNDRILQCTRTENRSVSHSASQLRNEPVPALLRIQLAAESLRLVRTALLLT